MSKQVKKTESGFNTSRTYRLTTMMAYELDKTAQLLTITESELIRTLIRNGLQEIYSGDTI